MQFIDVVVFDILNRQGFEPGRNACAIHAFIFLAGLLLAGVLFGVAWPNFINGQSPFLSVAFCKWVDSGGNLQKKVFSDLAGLVQGDGGEVAYLGAAFFSGFGAEVEIERFPFFKGS